ARRSRRSRCWRRRARDSAVRPYPCRKLFSAPTRPPHEIAGDVGEGGGSGEGHGQIELFAELAEDPGDAGFAVGREAPEDGAADEDGAGSQGQRLEDVGAAPHAAVEEDLDPVAGG